MYDYILYTLIIIIILSLSYMMWTGVDFGRVIITTEFDYDDTLVHDVEESE